MSRMSQITLSEEQQRVIDAIKAHHNVICDSVAGSGKTTTVLNIAKVLDPHPILLLTYNQRLKLETRERVKDMCIENMHVHSFHSFAVKHYKRDCFTDFELAEVITSNPEPFFDYKYSHIIIDEAQDLTPLYYRFVIKVIQDNQHHKPPHMCILGDRNQSIFKFNHADERFIVYANTLFAINHHTWKTVHLSTSYRITQQMADFINGCVLNSKRMCAPKQGDKVRYIVCNCFSNRSTGGRAFAEVVRYLQIYSYQDIFVLAPSVKSNKSPIRLLANTVSLKLGIPIFVPNSDEDRLDHSILQGKMVFSTFHQVKGLERKVVLVFGFDDSYMTYYHKEVGDSCPNALYVAITRSLECLTVFHHYENGYLPFLNTQSLYKIAHVENMHDISPIESKEFKKQWAVTDLTRHLSFHAINKCMSYLKVKTLKEPTAFINIPTKTMQGNLFETTSEITGTAIPGYFCYKATGKLPFGTCTYEGPPENLTPAELLRLANQYCAEKSRYIFKTLQITDYNWLTDVQLALCIDRLHEHVPCPENAQFEVQQESTTCGKVKGYIDCIDPQTKTIWEFKCTGTIEKEYLVQMAAYAYLVMDNNKHDGYNFKVLNILTGEVVKVKTTHAKAKQMLEYLVFVKSTSGTTQSDTEFVDEMKKYLPCPNDLYHQQ